ncbi:hypothetical protein [Ruminococcus sp.]|uniref:hypothetical protein n=1 Tax=Ruminococcus sp. TaxID=41978 RepID=UPI003991CCAE
MIASGGTLPTLQQLKLPAEQANFSFGRAFGRHRPADRQNDLCHRQRRHAPGSGLVRGVTDDGETVLRKSVASRNRELHRKQRHFSAG